MPNVEINRLSKQVIESGVVRRTPPFHPANGVRSILGAACALFLLSFATERQAAAYTDPGSGALIWQMLIAGFVGAMFYLRKFTSWFRKKKESKD